MPVDSALIHAAQVVQYERSGTRSAQGDYPMVKTVGPWFDARVMLSDRGGTPRQPVAAGTEAGRAPVGYQVLAGTEDQNGDPLVLPSSGWLQTDCPVLNNPTIVISGQPEFLNDGNDPIGWLVEGDVVEDIP